MTEVQETVIEHCSGGHFATVTAAEKTSRNLVLRLAKKYPSEVFIIAENNDGSLLAHVPWKWVKISAPRKMTEEQRQKAAERLRHIREV